MATRDAYIGKMKSKLDEWNAEIDKLDAKLGTAQADARIRYEKELARLRSTRDDARRKLEQARAATAERWDELKEGLEEFWAHAEKAVGPRS